MSYGEIKEIFVKLKDEAVDVWRPVRAEHIREDIYRIIPQSYDETVETWEFKPGDSVICSMTTGADGEFLAAIKKAQT